ncbi:MAG: hypothetical protein KAS72_11525 [Phycisphaerales bacterium]|nr:hypothetical protein [Phycisphaerales bacterium]
MERFEQVLGSYGVSIASRSELEAICLEIQDLEDKRTRRSPLPEDTDFRAEMSRAMGVLHFAELLVATFDRGRRLDILKPHMELFNGASVAQNVRRIGDDKANKLFELLLALACMNFGTKVALDHPVTSKGHNPDVMFCHADTKWALACKVPNGDSTISAYDNIKSAVSQIDRSDADRGLVVLNARNWINHDSLWSNPGGAVIGKPDEQDIHWAWATAEMPFSMLRAEADDRYHAVLRDKGEELLEVFDKSAKAVPAVLNFLQSATLIASPYGPLMSRVGTFVVWPTGAEDDGTLCVVAKLNEAMFRLPAIPGLE